MPADFYELLGVRQDASDEEIKRAYRRLAREHHPDANDGDLASEARFKEITAAYETLRDPERRQRYDTFGPEGVRGAGAQGGFGGGFGAAGGFGDLFDAFFGQAGGFGQPGRPHRGEDAEVVVGLSFEDAVFGTDVEVPLDLPTPCDTCHATGARPGTTPVTCPECQGAGAVRRVRQSLLGQMVTATPCNSCRGTGEIVSSPCTDCGGEGRRSGRHTITVQVPAGVSNGATLRVSGQGPAPLRGGPMGDLYVHLRVADHARFDRAGDDLTATVHVQFTHAALGAEVEIETLDGPEVIKIAAGTHSGKVFRIRDKGVPQLRGRGRGDLLVRVEVDTPTRLSKQEEDLLRQFADARGDEVAAPEGGLLSRIRSSLG